MLRNQLLLGTAFVGLAAAGIIYSGDPARAQTLPQGGVVTAGSATISSPSADGLLIEQGMSAAIINWQSFSVGGGATAHFDNGAGATLNRVVGNDPSLIAGTLSATGSLYLVNQAGVTVGPGGQVLTGGSFVASTQDVLDSDFLNGGDLVFSGSSKAEIINHGIIRSAMGDVALIARRVENTGEIEALQGTVGLLAGYEVLMREASGAEGKFAVRIGGPDTEVVNSGTIRAAEAELRANGGNVYALGINTKGVIKATGARRKGGRIFLTAEGGRVEVGGTVRAERKVVRRVVQAAQPKAHGGEVFINADAIKISGHIDVSGIDGGKGGTIKAVATGALSMNATAGLDASGSAGGFIETSGADVRVGGSVNAGSGGNWLIDPVNLTVDGGNVGTYVAALNGGSNVILDTSGPGAQAGNITIESAMNWSGTGLLTLRADNDIAIDAAITAANGSLLIDAANTITASAPVNVGAFTLQRGDWVQNAVVLPDFHAGDFRIEGGSFLRATGGNGSIAAPYLIADIFGLQGIGSRADYRAANWALAGDIDASGTASWNGGAGWKPIGNWNLTAEYFTGRFDGNGNTISDLTVFRPEEGYVGFFGLTQNAAVVDVLISGATIRGAYSVGILAGQVIARDGNSLVSGVEVDGQVNGLQGVGGLIGQHYAITGVATIENSGSNAAVSGLYNTGGLLGYNLASGHSSSTSAIVRDATSAGTVYGQEYAGGLVGQQRSSSNGLARIEGSSSRASVSGQRSVGGLVGSNNGDGGQVEIQASSAFGSVTATGDNVGGLVGYNIGQASIASSHASGNVIGRNEVGGLVGFHFSTSPWGAATISRSFAAGSVTGVSDVGGLVGRSYSAHGRSTNIDLSFASGRVTGSSAVGGLVGLSTSFNYGYNYLFNSGWDVEGTQQSAAVGVTDGWSYEYAVGGLSGADNYQQSSYEALGWNFASDWFMIDGSTRPFLRSEYSTTITNARQLQLMAMDLGASYTLANDIDFAAAFATGMWSARGFAPIGIDAAGNPLGGINEFGGFQGSFNGAGYAISDLIIDRTGPRSGLFGHVGGSGVISNVVLDGGSIAGGAFTGGLAGVLFGDIYDSWTDGAAVSGTSNVGGLVGYAGAGVGTSPEIWRSSTTGTVTSTSTGSAGNAGGLVGRLAGGRIVQSYSSASVTSNRDAVGGLVGWVSNGGTIHHSYANGSATGRSGVGGLVGRVDGGSTLEYVYSYASATGQAIAGGSGPAGVDVGGLVGNNAGTIRQAWASGRVIGVSGPPSEGTSLGGLVGKNEGSVLQSYFDNQTTGRTTGIGVNTGSGAATGRTTAELMQPGTFVGWGVNTGSSNVPPPPGWWQVAGETRPFLTTEYSLGIRNAHQFQLLSSDLGASYTLLADIDASITDGAASPAAMWSSRGFVPVGVGGTGNPFGGSLDGGFHIILGLTIDRPTTDYVGLFGAALNASIRNVGVVHADIVGRSHVGSLAGITLARASGSVENAWSSGDISGSQYVGGLIGMSAAQQGGLMALRNVRSSANVSGTAGETAFTTPNAYLGGLLGINLANGGEATVRNAVATGNVTGSANASENRYLGGLTGGNVSIGARASIEIAFATGDVFGIAPNNQAIGGFVGLNGSLDGQALIADAYAIGDVNASGGASTDVGGFAGHNVDLGNGIASIARTFASGSVTASDTQAGTVGSLIGMIDQSAGTGAASVTSSFWQSAPGLPGIGSDTGGVTDSTGLTVSTFQDTDAFMVLARARGWDFERIWAPPSAGYHPDLYAISPVVRVDIGSLERQYGDANTDLGRARTFGGPSAYVFGFANDSLLLYGAPATAASASSPVGSYAVTLPGSVVSYGGVAYRLVGTGEMRVTPRDLQLEGYREYNGGLEIDGSDFFLYNVVNGDVVNVSGVGIATGADAGVWDYLASLGTLAIDNPNYRIREDWAYYYIYQRSIELGGTRAYDGTANVDIADLVITNLVAGDTVNLSGSGVTLDGADAGQQAIVDFRDLAVDNQNYTLWSASGSVTITPRNLVVSADHKSKPQGAIDPALTWQVTGGMGFVGTDSAATVISGSLERAAGESAGSYAIGQGSLAASSNYEIAFVGGVMTILFVEEPASVLSATGPQPGNPSGLQEKPGESGNPSGLYEKPGEFAPPAAGSNLDLPGSENCRTGVLGPDCEAVPHPDNRQIGNLSFAAD